MLLGYKHSSKYLILCSAKESRIRVINRPNHFNFKVEYLFKVEKRANPFQFHFFFLRNAFANIEHLPFNMSLHVNGEKALSKRVTPLLVAFEIHGSPSLLRTLYANAPVCFFSSFFFTFASRIVPRLFLRVHNATRTRGSWR